MRIAVVDFYQSVRDNLISLLSGEPGFEVTGTFSSAEETLLFCDFSKVDVLLLDVDMPGMSGIKFISEVRAKFPEVDIMVYTACDSKAVVFGAVKAGASAYLLKGCRSTELINALTELYDGGAPMAPKIERMLISEFQRKGAGGNHFLSRREREILKEIEHGLSYKEVASKLNISTHTINSHVKNIYGKLKVQNKREALIKARNKGVI